VPLRGWRFEAIAKPTSESGESLLGPDKASNRRRLMLTSSGRTRFKSNRKHATSSCVRYVDGPNKSPCFESLGANSRSIPQSNR
jgi:hypothetical protein